VFKSKYRFYLITIIIGVVCATYFIYAEHRDAGPAASSVVPVADNYPQPQVTAYDMGIYLDINTRTIHGNTVIDTVNTSGQVLQELWFTTYPNAFRDSTRTPAPREAYYSGFNEGWLKIDHLTVNGVTAKYQEQGIAVQALLASPILSGKNIKIEMTWRAKIPRLAYRYGSKSGVYMLGNFYPTLNVLGVDGWHNWQNSKFGDPFCFPVANYQVNINLPETYNMVSTGTITRAVAEDNGRTIYWSKADKVRDFCLLVMYDYQEMGKEIQGRSIKCYAPSNNKDIASLIVEQSGEILNFYSSMLCSYPYPDFKVAFVPMKGFQGMEYSGLVFLQEEFLNPAYDSGKRDFVLAHEIAHQWWYAMVGNDQFREPWLDEGLANWCACKYLQKTKGQSIPDSNNYQQGIKLTRQLDEMNSRQDYYRTAYNGGEAFWFGLEKEIGEEAVVNILRSYLGQYKFKIASSQDLFTLIKKEAPTDVEAYLQKWL
jgi:hypothetical protein